MKRSGRLGRGARVGYRRMLGAGFLRHVLLVLLGAGLLGALADLLGYGRLAGLGSGSVDGTRECDGERDEQQSSEQLFHFLPPVCGLVIL